MRSQLLRLLCLCVLIETLAARGSLALGTVDLAGTFRLVAEQSDDVDRAIDQAIAPMSFVARPFARSRLRQINPLYPRLTIASTLDAVVVVADPRVPIRTPANGAAIAWSREDGERFEVHGVWNGGTFEQTFVSGSGRRVNRYSASPDGRTLTLQVRITGGGLPGLMTYQLVYQRVA